MAFNFAESLTILGRNLRSIVSQLSGTNSQVQGGRLNRQNRQPEAWAQPTGVRTRTGAHTGTHTGTRTGTRPGRRNRQNTRGVRNNREETIMFDELIRKSANASEQDFRLIILNALLNTPHRQVAPYIPLFNYVHERDPLFFGHLAAWYVDNGSVRDLKQLFVAYLATSRFSDEFRSAGLAMLQKMAPYEVERVLGIIKVHDENGKHIDGIASSVPRSVKTTVEHYLRDRESNHEAFDKVVLHARKPMKTLYASLRIKPGEYAQKVLFDNAPPEGSPLHVLKLLARATDPVEQATLIAEHNIPYRVAVSGLKQVTPTVMAALLCSMTPQEVINNLASLKKRGVMDNPDLRKVIESKLASAQTDKRVSALKTRQALKSANLDDDMAQRVESVGDKQIKAKATIKRSTALLIDKSGSMDIAIDVGKQIASIIAPICDAELFVYAFDTMAYTIDAKGNNELSDWEKAFKGIKAGGSTSYGVAVDLMRRRKQAVEQIIMVTDQEENNAPLMAPTLKSYADELKVMPNVIIVNVGRHSTHLEQTLAKAEIGVDTFNFNGDYYSLPSLLPMLAGGTRAEFLMDIMAYPLPERKLRVLTPA